MNVEQWIAEHADDLRRVQPWKNAISVIAPEGRGTGFVINIDTKRVIAQFVVWISGAMEATVAAVDSAEVVYFDAAEIANDAELDERWREFVTAITRLESGQ